MNIKDINKENFLKFALNENETTMENGKIFKVVQDDITYIVCGDFTKEIPSMNNNEVTVFGFVHGGRFYGIAYGTDDIDLDYHYEYRSFITKFYTDYDNAIKRYSLDNPAPVTDKTKADEHTNKDFESYCEFQASKDAIRELFGAPKAVDIIYDEITFSKIFMDCLKHPGNYADYIQTAIEENANDINFKIKCNVEKDKALETLKTNDEILLRRKIYQALKGIDNNRGKDKRIKMLCNLYGETFELSIWLDTLRTKLLDYHYISILHFSKNVVEKIKQAAVNAGHEKCEAKILFTDIQKITYGKKVLFEKSE